MATWRICTRRSPGPNDTSFPPKPNDAEWGRRIHFGAETSAKAEVDSTGAEKTSLLRKRTENSQQKIAKNKLFWSYETSRGFSTGK